MEKCCLTPEMCEILKNKAKRGEEKSESKTKIPRKKYAVRLAKPDDWTGYMHTIEMMTTINRLSAVDYYQSHMHYIPDDSRIYLVEIENGKETRIMSDNSFRRSSDYFDYED